MPTDLRLARLSCYINDDTDPSLWICDFIGVEPATGALQAGTIDAEPTDVIGNELDDWATDNDFTLV